MTGTRGTGVTTYVLDAGALIAVERADPTITALLTRVRSGSARLILAEAVVAQAWRTGSGRQARLAALLALKPDRCRSVPLDREAAKSIGRAIGESGHTDVVDVHVAVLTRTFDAVVVTSDRPDLVAVAPEIADRVIDV